MTLFKSGEDALRVDRDAVRAGSRYSRGLGFIDSPWGEKARQLVKTTSRLDDTLWGMIKESASAHLSVADEESDDDVIEALNPHAYIDLDW